MCAPSILDLNTQQTLPELVSCSPGAIMQTFTNVSQVASAEGQVYLLSCIASITHPLLAAIRNPSRCCGHEQQRDLLHVAHLQPSEWLPSRGGQGLSRWQVCPVTGKICAGFCRARPGQTYANLLWTFLQSIQGSPSRTAAAPGRQPAPRGRGWGCHTLLSLLTGAGLAVAGGGRGRMPAGG